jgi:hypothetical protein
LLALVAVVATVVSMGVESIVDAASDFMVEVMAVAIVTSIEVAAMAMATVTTDRMAIILIMVTTVLILEPQLASVF